MQRRRWQQGGGGDGDVVTVPFARENSSAMEKIVPQIVPRIVPKPRRKIVFFEEVSALFEVLFGGTINSTVLSGWLASDIVR